MRKREFKVLQDEAYQYIRERILDGTMVYNKIYSESKIAVEIGISRTPVRDAVHRLYQESLIDIIPNKGFSLHKMNEQDVMETYEIRSSIEGYCSRKAALNVTSDTVKKLLSKLDISIRRQEEIVLSDHDVSAFAQEDQNFHYLLVLHSENQAFIDIFSQYMYRIKKFASYSLTKEGRMDATLSEHKDILEKIRKGDAEAAYAATLFHMKAPLGYNLETVYSQS